MHFKIVLYNPPSFKDVFYELSKLMKLVAHKSEVIVLGDFNIDWFNSGKRKKLKTLMTKFDFTQIIKGATRISKSSRAQIDLIFSNKNDRILKSYNFLTGLSDHNMILVARKLSKKRLLNINKTQSNILTILKRDFPAVDNELNALDWSTTLDNDDVHNCCKEVMNKVEGIISKFLKPQKHLKKRTLTWINEELKKLMKERDLALKKSVKTKLSSDINIFKSLRNQITKNIRKAKAEYYITTITEAKGSPLIMWKQINGIVKPSGKSKNIHELRIGGRQIRDSKQIALEFNTFFVSSVEELVQQVNAEQQIKFTKHQSINHYSSFSLQQTNEAKVLEAINSVNNSYSKDLFHINTVFLKRNKYTFVKSLTHLINLSIQSGQFPTPWKQAKVMPLFKSGTPDQACNYRPVSILPVFSKVLEKIVYGQLMAFIQSNNILHP